MTTTVGRVILDTLIEINGIMCSIFGVCGAAWYPLDKDIQTYENMGLIQYVGVTNESSGGLLATYYSLDERIGCLFTTAGPGTTEAVTAVSNAFYEERPFLIFCGLPSNTNFQYIDTDIMKTITKQVFIIDSSVSNIKQIVYNAYTISYQGTQNNPGPGPVALFVYKDMYETPVRKIDQVAIPYTPVLYTYSELFETLKGLVQPTDKIVIRLGTRVSAQVIQQCIHLSDVNENIVVSLTYSIANVVSDVWSYPRVVVEGPLSTFEANSVYSAVDRVFQIGIGIVYPLIEFVDVTKIPGIPWAQESLLFNFTDENYVYSEAPSAFLNTSVGNVNDFTIECITFLKNIGSETSWTLNKTQDSLEFGNTLFTYFSQRTPSTVDDSILNFTSGSAIATVFLTLYSLQSQDSFFVLDDSYVYMNDIGASGFIGGQLLRHQKREHVFTFCQFSPIGCSPSALAGLLLGRKDAYTDCVLVLGDGGFLNTTSYVIDLNNMLYTLQKRCLLIFCDDTWYANVAIAEEAIFGSYTNMTSTAPLQKNVTATTIVHCMSNPVRSLVVPDLNQSTQSSVVEFVQQWYTRAPGFDVPGMYALLFSTRSLPVFIQYNS